MAAEENHSELPFRQQALEYIATPKALDEFIQISSPLAWVLALAFWIIAITVIAWLLFGSLVTHIAGKGILISADEAVIYVSALETQRIQTGMPVHLSPSGMKQWEYSRIPGAVTQRENLPATPEDMLALLKNQSLVNYFLQNGPVITLHARLQPHKSPAYTLTPGALIDVRITVRRQTPLSVLLSR
jgi:hypothetical protein